MRTRRSELEKRAYQRGVIGVITQAEANGADPEWVDRWLDVLRSEGVRIIRTPGGGFLWLWREEEHERNGRAAAGA